MNSLDKMEDYDRLKQERDELHRIVCRCLFSLDNGAGATENCSVNFLQNAPVETTLVIQQLKKERDELAAQVDVMRKALLEADRHLDDEEYSKTSRSRKRIARALSLAPSDALREIEARVLENKDRQPCSVCFSRSCNGECMGD